MIEVRLRRNADGEERVYKETIPEGWTDDPEGAAEFMWTDGNYACDCNRVLFFAYAEGREATEEEWAEACVPVGRYTLVSLHVNGKLVTSEDPGLAQRIESG